jgi:hypothetical protein
MAQEQPTEKEEPKIAAHQRRFRPFDPSSQTMRDYRWHVAVLKLRSRIPLERQWPELYAELKGAAWDQAEDLDPSTLIGTDGVDILLQFLARKFDDTKVMELGDELKKFFTKMRRAAGEAMREFVNIFDNQLARLKLMGVTFPEEALAGYSFGGSVYPRRERQAC